MLPLEGSSALPSAPPRPGIPAVGEVVAGRYRITGVLGEGGMGIVLAAEHATLGEPVAIKVMLAEAASSDEARERFLREARATARIHSDHVVRILDVGTTDRGAPFLVMERLVGQDLQQRLEEQGALPFAHVVPLILQACAGLAAAHAMKIVHRDVKTQNLFVTRRNDGSEQVKVLDFGIAKAGMVSSSSLDKSLTNTAASFGTPTHMSPEQVRSSKDVDARADVWAIGVVTYELLSGRLPFDGTSAAGVLAAVIADDPAPLPPAVPAPLAAVVRRCLEKDANRRWPSVAALARALAPFAPGSRALVAEILRIGGDAGGAPPARARRWARDGRVLVAIGAFGLALGAIVVVAVAGTRRPEPAAGAVAAEVRPAPTVGAATERATAAASAATDRPGAPTATPAASAAPHAVEATTSTVSRAIPTPTAAPRRPRVPDPTADRE